jgi:PIN domain nuclease of toxin-antitoxin system
MRLLLDTHVLIWWDAGARLSKRAADAIRAADQVYVSAVSGWEIAIKTSLGRIETTRDVGVAVSESGFEELPLRLSHTEALRLLPPHHRDPFDRMLIAQAVSEGLTLVTRDRALDDYGISRIRA